MPCRALEAFGLADVVHSPDEAVRLNALSGIGGVWTDYPPELIEELKEESLMPCRALEAFGLC